MSRTSSYDVVVGGAIATLIRVLHAPNENLVEPGNYSFAGWLERADTAEGLPGQDVRLVVDGVTVISAITGDAGWWEFFFYIEPGATYMVKVTFAGTAEHEASETTTYSLTPTL